MCEPMTIAAVGTAVAGAGISMYSRRQAAQYEAGVAESNRELALQQGRDARAQGVQEAAAIEAMGARAAASATAEFAAGGLETTVGSPATAIAASAFNAAADASAARAAASRQAWGFETEAQDYRARGRMTKRASLLANVGEGFSAGASLFAAGRKAF